MKWAKSPLKVVLQRIPKCQWMMPNMDISRYKKLTMGYHNQMSMLLPSLVRLRFGIIYQLGTNHTFGMNTGTKSID